MVLSGLDATLQSTIEEFRPDLEPFETIYRDLHQHPELSKQEERTSRIAASHLRELGYSVTTSIGGYGLTGVLKNGDGPTILLRADMDALPMREQTNLPYASTDTAIDADGNRKPVMHSCGHDTHVASLMGASTLLRHAKSKWHGTLIVLFQPDEENGAGARAMLDDNLYDKIPRPDLVLGQHLLPIRSGAVQIRPDVCMAAADTLAVRIYGRSAHASQPQDSIDPVVIAASTILRLQTIVAREISPADVSTVSCTNVHGGEAHNIIPNEVKLIINIRTFDTAVREKIITAIKRIVRGEAVAAGVAREPQVESILQYPLTVNDVSATGKIRDAFVAFFGEANTWEAPRWTASEDFSLLASAVNVPSVYWNFGCVDVNTWNEFERSKDPQLIPRNHQVNFAPVIEPTLKTGIDAISLAALTFLADTN